MQLVITNSMRTTFLDCQYKFFLEYILRLSPTREAEYFTWGRLVHDCKEAQEKGESIDLAIQHAREETAACQPNLKKLQRFDELATIAPTCVDAHFLKWHEQDKHYENLNIESKFEMPLPCGWCFKGKIDKGVRDIRTGKKLLWERKTAALTGEEFWDSKWLDSQPRGYLLAGRHVLGLDVDTVMYDVFCKPQYRLKQGQSREAWVQEIAEAYLLERDRFFERRPITFKPEEIENYLWSINNVAQTIQWHMEEGIWEQHHPGNRKGGCDYAPICFRNDYSNFFERDESMLNPELGVKSENTQIAHPG